MNHFVKGGLPRNKILQGINLLVGSQKDDEFMTMGLTEVCTYYKFILIHIDSLPMFYIIVRVYVFEDS